MQNSDNLRILRFSASVVLRLSVRQSGCLARSCLFLSLRLGSTSVADPWTSELWPLHKYDGAQPLKAVSEPRGKIALEGRLRLLAVKHPALT